MRERSMLLRVLLVAAIIFCAQAQLFAQSVVLNETEITEDDSAVKILYATNRTVPVECYDLSVPPQIVVDFMGDIFYKGPEVKTINKGVVKQMRIVKGTKTSSDLGDGYYSIDFIIVDLKEGVKYDFDQGLTTSVLIVSKPGQKMPKAVAPKPEPAVAAPVTAAVDNTAGQSYAAAPVEKAAVAKINFDEKEYEPAYEPIEKTSKRTRKSDSGEKTGLSTKIAGGFKSLFGKKEGSSEQVQASEEKQSTRRQKAAEKKKRRDEIRNKKEEAAQKRDEKKKAALAKKKEASETKKEKTTRRRKKKVEKKDAAVVEDKAELKKRKRPSRSKVKQDPAPVEEKTVAQPVISSGPAGRVEQAKQKVVAAKAAFREARKNLAVSKTKLADVKAEQSSFGEKLKFSQAKVGLAKDAYDDSIKNMQAVKGEANSIWVEYSNAKAKLATLLDNGSDAAVIDKAQKSYDDTKVRLEKAIEAAESAKKASDAKLAEYNEVKNESLMMAEKSANPQSIIGEAEQVTVQNKNILDRRQADLDNAEQELADAEIALKKYELEKADLEYKKSLEVIDSQMMERLAEEKRKEESLRRQLEDENRKAEEARNRQIAKEKEAAQLAALAALETDQKNKEDAEIRQRTKRSSRSAMRKASVPEKAVSQEGGLRADTLESALELRNAGLEMQRKGDLDSAVKYYQQALMQDPGYATVHNDLGILYEQKGLEEKAKMEYLSALKIDPQYIKAHSNLALLYEKSGDYKKAYYHWKQRVNLGREDDPWTQKAKQRMEMLENRK